MTGKNSVIEHVRIVTKARIDDGKITIENGIKTLVDHRSWQKK
jgi:hypothetical protein